MEKFEELDSDTPANQPWLSSDGMTIYWTAGGSRKGIWTASRDSVDSLFKNQREIMPQALHQH